MTTVKVPKQCNAYLKSEILDILVEWSEGKLGTGLVYERIIEIAARDAALMELARLGQELDDT